MAEFLILIYGDEQQWDAETEADNREKDAAHRAFVAAVGPGLREGRQLAASSAATTLRARGGKPWATDGPFTESKEVLGGFYFIDVADRAEAVRLASMLPELTKPYCAVEVLPVHAP
ncbi:YciI family protein [Acidothermaceae bacterium B102]|nr:YciI family protein [Acidothermaceae bacterium B102]